MIVSGGIVISIVIFYNLLSLPAASMILMSGHSLGRKTSRQRLNHLMRSFIYGHLFALWLLICALGFLVQNYLLIKFNLTNKLIWLMTLSLIIIQISLMIITIFRRQTHPWILPAVKKFLFTRCTKTRSGVEAFSLGLSAVILQLPTILLPMTLFVLVSLQVFYNYLLTTILLASLAMLINLLATYFLQKRETNTIRFHKSIIKEHYFLQIMTIITLIIITVLIFTHIIESGGIA